MSLDANEVKALGKRLVGSHASLETAAVAAGVSVKALKGMVYEGRASDRLAEVVQEAVSRVETGADGGDIVTVRLSRDTLRVFRRLVDKPMGRFMVALPDHAVADFLADMAASAVEQILAEAPEVRDAPVAAHRETPQATIGDVEVPITRCKLDRLCRVAALVGMRGDDALEEYITRVVDKPSPPTLVSLLPTYQIASGLIGVANNLKREREHVRQHA